MDGKAVSHEVMRATNIYMIVYLMLMAVSIFIISFDEFDLVTNFTAVATTLNNVGPGLSLIGPTGNFGIFLRCPNLYFLLTCLQDDWSCSPF